MTGPAGAAAALATVAVLAAGDARRVARSRLRQLSSGRPAHRPRAGWSPTTKWLVVLLILAPAAIRSLGPGPVLAGLTPLLILWTWRLLAARSAARCRWREVASTLPRFADLVAACLESGATPADAVDVVRRNLGGPLADRLAPVAVALRSGVDPLRVYGDHGRDDPVRGLVAALARAMDSGAPLADTVSAVADDQRRRRRWSAEAAARRAGVHAVGPLVVCFLPAFVLLGVVPVVLAIATEVLSDLS